MNPRPLALLIAYLLALLLAGGCAKKTPSPTASASVQPQGQAAAPSGGDIITPKPAPVATKAGTTNGDQRFSDADLAGGYVEEAGARTSAPAVADPLEGWNRMWFAVNDVLYLHVVDPVGDVWRQALPGVLRQGIRNAFYNIRFPSRLVNNLLQAKFVGAGQETGRFLINTLFGFGGLVQTHQGFGEALNPPPEDLGQTLGAWGLGNGFYLVWPLLGPSTLRDTAGMVGDGFLDPIGYVDPWYYAVAARAGEKINQASFYVGEYAKIKAAFVDPYTGFKDAYIQSRAESIAK